MSIGIAASLRSSRSASPERLHHGKPAEAAADYHDVMIGGRRPGRGGWPVDVWLGRRSLDALEQGIRLQHRSGTSLWNFMIDA
jgi:hypothetical protein